MAERDLNQDAVSYITAQESVLSDALKADNWSSDLRSQLEIELLLVRGARIMTAFYFQEQRVETLAANLIKARLIALGRLNPEAARLGILNIPAGEKASASDIADTQRPSEGEER